MAFLNSLCDLNSENEILTVKIMNCDLCIYNGSAMHYFEEFKEDLYVIHLQQVMFSYPYNVW